MKLLVRSCKVCGDDFTQETKQGRPRAICSQSCKGSASNAAIERYRKSDKYKKAMERAAQKKKEVWNPWLWENTILEWDE